MPYSIEPISEDCYPGTTVLINQFDIRDAQKLAEVEGVLTATRTAQWLNAPKADDFSFAHYREIHRYLFADLYAWAGQLRAVDLSKKGTQFCKWDKIAEESARVFNGLKRQNFLKNITRDQFLSELTDFYCKTNFLHPFREGNGRTQRVFLTQLVRNAGYDIKLSGLSSKRSDNSFRTRRISAFVPISAKRHIALNFSSGDIETAPE